MWDEEEEADDGRQKTPKQRLLGWIQNKLPELPITNFNRDWQTGRALGALVDSCAPGDFFKGVYILVYKQRGQTDEKDHNVKLRALCKPNVSSLPYSSDLIQSTLDTSGKKAVTIRVRSR